MKRWVCSVLVGCLVLSGCTPYKARQDGWSRIGYTESPLPAGGYTLSYFGATHSKPETIEKLWHQRAGELCDGAEYDYKITKKDHWLSNGYSILPPFVLKVAAPTLTGEVHCTGPKK